MNILISNDDGIHAPGINVLHKFLSEVGTVTSIAPAQERSTTGHSLSLDHPLRLQKAGDNMYGCTGFPADCVLMGLGHVLNEKPDLVVSGINRGANLGQDMYYSGTVAAAREAAFHGVPSIAVSLCLDYDNPSNHYDSAAKIVQMLIKEDVSNMISELSLINVNVPDLEWKDIKGIRLTKIGYKDYSESINARIDSRNRNYYWVEGAYRGFREEDDSDCACVDQGYISVTPHFLTDYTDRNIDEIKFLIERMNKDF